MKTCLVASLNVKTRVTIWLSNSTPMYIPKRNKNTSTQKLAHEGPQQCYIHNCTFLLTTQCSSTATWINKIWHIHRRGFPVGSDSKESACNAGDPGSIPGSGRSPGEGNGNPLWYSCLENPWTVELGRLQSGVTESQTRLSESLDCVLADYWCDSFGWTAKELSHIHTCCILLYVGFWLSKACLPMQETWVRSLDQ